MSLSFTQDGFFEQAQFSWTSNATGELENDMRLEASHSDISMCFRSTDPHCIQAVVLWQHGTYSQETDGSITTDPGEFAADGRIQVNQSQ